MTSTDTIVRQIVREMCEVVHLIDGLPPDQLTPPMQHLRERLENALDEYDFERMKK